MKIKTMAWSSYTVTIMVGYTFKSKKRKPREESKPLPEEKESKE